jgi:hypothetical protein
MDTSGDLSMTPVDRVGALMGGGPTPTSSVKTTPTETTTTSTSTDKKAKKKRNIESTKTYRFNLTLKSCETNGKEVTKQFDFNNCLL